MRRLETLERVNWFRILADLQVIGWNNTAVAKALFVPTSTLRGWKDGSEPTHFDGDRLLTLWRDTTGKIAVPRIELPTKVGIPPLRRRDSSGH